MKTTLNNSSLWNNSYLFNIPEIDKQHKKLFDIYDQLSNMINNNMETNHAAVENVIDELVDYTKYHFQTEEAFLRKVDFTDIDEHIKEHKLFIKKLSDCTLAFEYKNPLLVDNMLSFIKKWLVSHILQSDAEYKDEVRLYLEDNHTN